MVRNSTQNRRLNGLNPLSYLGDNPTTPPNFYSVNMDPTVNDWQNFALCDLWLNTSTEDVFILVNLNNNQATWVKISTGAVGDLEKLTGDSGGPVLPTANNINVITNVAGNNSGATVAIVGTPATSTLTLNVTNGVSQNTFIGENSGNLTLNGANAVSNTAVGLGTLHALVGTAGGNAQNNNAFGVGALGACTNGSNNCGISTGALAMLSTGNANTAIGEGALNRTNGSQNVALGAGTSANSGTPTGSNNVFIGTASGTAYTGAESNNILIGTQVAGTLGESNIIRIGNGAGLTPQTQTFLTGNISQPTNSAFNATLTGATTNNTGDGTVYTIAFNTTLFDQNSNFNTGTSTFTAPVTGIYNFSSSVFLQNLGAGHTIGFLQLVISGTSAKTYDLADINAGAVRDANNNLILGGTLSVKMTAVDTAVVNITVFSSTKTVGLATQTYFSGVLVS